MLNESQTYDLAIIGAGPAGSAAAITAARSGARVLLLERGRFPRQKVCGEFTSAESLALLARLLGENHQSLLQDAVRIHRARVFLDDQTFETPVTPPAASIARIDLDQALWLSAQQLGVETRAAITVEQISGHGPFQIATKDGIFNSRLVINASGRWSNLIADKSLANQSPKWIGMKGHFSAHLPSQPPDSTDLYFFEGGYCGIQSVRVASDPAERLNVCAMVLANVASSFEELFQQHPLLRKRAHDWTLVSDPVFTSPLIFRKPEPVRDSVFMVGDAAAFVDPFVGDGISLALRGGALAAECLKPAIGGAIDLQTAAKNYAESYRKQLAPVYRASSVLRRMLRLPSRIRKPLISLVNADPRIAQFLVTATR